MRRSLRYRPGLLTPEHAHDTYDVGMAQEHRRVAAQSAAHAQGLTDNLLKQKFVVESQTSGEWMLRKKRRRGDVVVTIAIMQPSMIHPVVPPVSWAPPKI